MAMRAIFYDLCKKGLCASKVSKEINDVESRGTVNESVTQNWF